MTVEKDVLINALKTVFDPEIPVNVWDMGLIYDIIINDDDIVIKMTFTSPTCPMMDELIQQVKEAVENAAGTMPVKIELVWDPPWDLTRMSDEARLELDLVNEGW